MLLRSRCGENCRCEGPHEKHRTRHRSLQKTPSYSGVEKEQSAWSSHRTESSVVAASELSSTDLSSLAGFSPPNSSTPNWAGVSRRRTVQDRRVDTSLSSVDLSAAYTTRSSAVLRQGILKSPDETELQSVKQVRFDGVRNGSVHWGDRYSDDSDADGAQDGRALNGVLKSNGHFAGDSATQATSTTTTTTTTRTVTTELPNGDTMGDIYSDDEDEGQAVPRMRGRQRPAVHRAVYVVGAQNAAAAGGAARTAGADWRYRHGGTQRVAWAEAAGAWGGPVVEQLEVSSSFWRSLWDWLLSIWKVVYLAAAALIVCDAWLLSRMSPRSRKRLAVAAFLLTALPLLAWVLWEEWEGEAWAPLAAVTPTLSSIGSSVYQAVFKVPGMLGGAVASLNLSLPWLARRNDQPAVSQSMTDAGPGLAASLSQLSDEQLDTLAQKVSDRLALVTPPSSDRDHDKQNEARMNRLALELQAHRTTVDRLVQRLGDREDCCKDVAALLAGLDTRIVAKVLEVLNDSSPAAPRSVLLRSFLEAVERREGHSATVLKAGLEELRHSLQAELALAMQSASQAQQMAREAKEAVQEAVEKARLSPPTVVSTSVAEAGGGSSTEEVTRIVKEMLAKYDADKTGLPDYALETAGGTVVNTRCTETYVDRAPKYYWYGVPLWTFARTAREAIRPEMQPGQCWPFRGSQGQLVVKLSQRVRVTAFTVEHISRSVAIGESISSAPREFQIWGLESENDSPGKLLGSYTYKLDADPLQQFIVQDPEPAIYEFIEMKILSNHGNLDYTCLYRLRVHGVPP
ncbi:uncharacterized protein LOC144138679 isoform X1 [Haemaphysalis longicornis]